MQGHLDIVGPEKDRLLLGWPAAVLGAGQGPLHRHGARSEHVDGADKTHHKGAGGMVVDLRRCADLLNVAFVHHHNAIGHLHGLLLVVGDDYGGDVHFIVEVAQPGPQLLAHLGVEGAEGLIEQQHPRLDGQGAGQGHPLALAAGKLGGIATAISPELDEVKQLVHPPANRLFFPMAQLQPKGHVLAHRPVLEKGKVLKDKTHLPLLHRPVGGLFTGDPDPAGISLLQTGDQPQQGALAGTGGTKQSHQGARININADIVHRLKIAKALADIGHADPHGGAAEVQ